jgi:protein-disulfide isomerase/uncharacterized membrane protein
MFAILEKLFEPGSNVSEVTKVLVDILQVKVTKTTLIKELDGHPDYPSLLSISDVLNAHGVENLAIKAEPDKLSQAPTPFIAVIRGEKSSGPLFTVVREVKTDSFSFFDPEAHTWTSFAAKDFLKRFSGTILLAEASEQAGEKQYDKNLREENRKKIIQQLSALCIPVIWLIAGAFAFVQNGMSALLPFIFSGLTLAGTVIGGLLLWYELDQYNPLLQQICSAGKKVNCGAILQSKASKIMGISWSTIGFTYFMGQLILELCTGIANPQTLLVLSWLNVLALPYVFFSLYYQWKVARQWCVLCLYVQGLLVLQFVTALSAGWHVAIPAAFIDPGTITMIMAAFAVPFIAVTLLLPALQKAKEGKNINNELQRLKHNPQIFEASLSRQKAVTETTEGLGILLGNPDAKNKIIKVCNPYCGPCAKAHVPMEELLDNNPDVQIQIIFTATNDPGDIKTPPVKHLLAIAAAKDEARTKKALDDWYLAEKKDYAVFAAKYPLNGDLQQQDQGVEAMRSWCDKTGIVFTPTFFVNGNQLPEFYTVSDLKYFFTV